MTSGAGSVTKQPNARSWQPRERFLFAALYFAEGVPIGLLWWALPAVLREASVDVGRITALTAALALPWTFKFLAGPVVDASAARGTSLRRWILVCQLGMGLALLPLAAQDSVPEYRLLLALLLVHACFAAVQDVSIDALCIRLVPRAHLGAVNGWMQFGMTLGRATAAAAVPLLIHAWGWRWAILLVVLLIWLPMGALLMLAREPGTPDPLPAPSGSLLSAFMRMALVPAIAVALLAGSGFEAVGALAGPLLVDLQFEPAARSAFFGLIAPAGLALGGLAAARFADRIRPPRALAAAVLAVAGATASLAVSLAAEPMPTAGALQLLLLGLVYLFAGFLISASYACFMAVANGPWAATKFSFLMAMTNACESASALAAGRIAASSGYAVAFPVLALVSLFSLPFVWKLARNGDIPHAAEQKDR